MGLIWKGIEREEKERKKIFINKGEPQKDLNLS